MYFSNAHDEIHVPSLIILLFIQCPLLQDQLMLMFLGLKL